MQNFLSIKKKTTKSTSDILFAPFYSIMKMYVKMESPENIFRDALPNFWPINSGIVFTLDFNNIGAKIQPSIIINITASHSKCPTANPLSAPEVANPTKCSLEIFVAKIENPMTNHPIFLLARK